jgi:hypothetical protein
MATAIVEDLRRDTDEAWAALTRQLVGMEAHLDAPEGPGQWTARDVLCHLLSAPGSRPVDFLKTFSDRELPLSPVEPGQTAVTPERRRMALADFVADLDARRREVFAYLDGLDEAALGRKARLPFLKSVMGTDEVPMPAYVRLIFVFHWNDHAGQLAKIRKTLGLPDAR